ncbi:MAG TPA: protein kinase [Bryobacteraceae bacterium]
MVTDPGQWKRVEELFDAALSEPVEARPAWLAERCRDAPGLAEEVQSLLDSYEEQERLHPPAPAAVNRRYGPYQVERSIGQGGMGAVYLAHRADGQFDQRVAIKVVARHAFGDLFLERFRLERQILASLDHPGISRLLDGGVAGDGALYLAMEYVEGTRIDLYCEKRTLDRRARLRLFQAVCAAVQYAHRNLVVHRDLKPDNILVREDGTPKLLDFGTAKLLTPIAEIAESELTQAGFRAFTPAYASPEQVLGNPVTTASDIYSLGVILHRLLAARAPYELKDHTTGELIRVVCEQEPAPAKVDPDIDAIIARCLRKNPLERYRSVDELIDDIEFHLHGRPVRASRAGVGYRARKFVRRNMVASAIAALLAGSIVLGIAGVLWQARIARSRYQDLRRLTNSLLFELNGVIRELPGSTAAQKMLVTKVLDNLDRLASGSTSDRQIQSDLADAYLAMGNLQGNPYEQNLGDSPGGLDTLRKALAIAGRLVQQQPSDVHALRTEAMLRQSIGDIFFGTGKPREAIENTTAAAAALERLAGAPGASAAAITEAAVSHETLGDEYGQPGAPSLGDIRNALAEYQKALALDDRALAADASYVRARRGIAVLEMKIGNLQLDADPQKALESYLTALKTFDMLPEKEAAAVGSRRIRATLLRKAGNAFEALEEWDRALGYYRQSLNVEESFAAIDPDDSHAQFQLAVILNSMSAVEEGKGDGKAAYQTATRVRGILEGVLRRDPTNPTYRSHLTEVWLQQVRLLRASGMAADAARLMTRAVATVRELATRPDARALDLCRAGQVLATAQPVELRDPKLAVDYAKKCVDLSGRLNPESLRILANAYRAAGRVEEGRRTAREGLALMPEGEHAGFVRRGLVEAAQ